MDIEQSLSGSGLTAVDRLAVRTSIAALEFLRQAAAGLGVSIDALTPELLVNWLDGQRSGG
jgi:hypothetical protein